MSIRNSASSSERNIKMTESQINEEVIKINRILKDFDKVEALVLSKITQDQDDDDDDTNLLGLRIRIIAATKILNERVPQKEELKKMDEKALRRELIRLLQKWDKEREKELEEFKKIREDAENWIDADIEFPEDFER